MAHSKLYIQLMNSKEWRTLRNTYMSAHPLCEECLAKGYTTAAQCVHHKIPCESGRTDQQVKELCLSYGNLQSLCFACHSATHQAERSHSKDAHQQRVRDRLEAWKARRLKQGGPPAPDFSPEGEKLPNPLALPSVET